MIPEINLNFKTVKVESKVRELRYSWVLGEPEFDKYRSVTEQKNYNFAKRLKSVYS